MPPSSSRIDLRRASILIVDDNLHALELLSQILLGFRVENAKACSSPAEARALLTQTHFDLLIIDGEMPNEDGINLTQHIRRHADQPNYMAPIILVSGHTPVAKVINARDAGANTLIKKPVAPAVLLGRIERLARQTRQFIATERYAGPDRRFRSRPLPPGAEERRAEALALTAVPDRALSQDDVNALFG